MNPNQASPVAAPQCPNETLQGFMGSAKSHLNDTTSLLEGLLVQVRGHVPESGAKTDVPPVEDHMLALGGEISAQAAHNFRLLNELKAAIG